MRAQPPIHQAASEPSFGFISDGSPDPRQSATRRVIRAAIAIAAAVAVVALLRISGTLADTDTALQVMGFDPDRSRLLTDLIAAAIAAAVSTLVAGDVLAATIAGMAGGGALFAHTFVHETQNAMRVRAGVGPFDPAGWVVSLLAIVMALLITAWATASLAGIVRRGLLRAAGDLGEFLGRDRKPGRLSRPVMIVAVFALLAVSLPVFGDMVNYEPDSHMNSGRAAALAAALNAGDGNGGSSAQPGPSGSPDPAASIGPDPSIQIVPGNTPNPSGGGSGSNPAGSGSPSAGVLSTATPWVAWKPSGSGSFLQASLPAPWTGGTRTSVTLDIYLPPGYSAGSRTYPVIYSVPFGIGGGWTTEVAIQSQLDSMITAGTFPASIVVFIPQVGGPFVDSECANSVDGREWYDTFASKTVVAYMDGNFRTIRTAAARSILGFSAGGFCSSMLVLKHPDIFSTAISISGYFQAGIVSSETPNAWRPFANNSAAVAAYSPLKLVGNLPSQLRSSIFLVLNADPTQSLFGPQMAAMETATKAAGVSMAIVPSATRHGWSTTRAVLPRLLILLAQRQAATHVFG